jgi:hypothetical protein
MLIVPITRNLPIVVVESGMILILVILIAAVLILAVSVLGILIDPTILRFHRTASYGKKEKHTACH